MSFQSDMLAYLATQTQLVGLVGTRIYTQIAPDATDRETLTGASTPYVVFAQVSGPRSYVTTGPDGLARPRYQFDCFATTESVAIQVADALRAALSGVSGTWGSTVVQAVFLLDEGAVLDSDPDQELSAEYGRRQDYEFTYRES